MACIVIGRKDGTNIGCSPTSFLDTARKMRFLQIAIAIVLIVVGTTLMLLIQ